MARIGFAFRLEDVADALDDVSQLRSIELINDAGGDVNISFPQGIDCLTLDQTTARHAELIRLKRHAIRQVGTDGETPRRA